MCHNLHLSVLPAKSWKQFNSLTSLDMAWPHPAVGLAKGTAKLQNEFEINCIDLEKARHKILAVIVS